MTIKRTLAQPEPPITPHRVSEADDAQGDHGARMKRLIFCFDGTWNRLDAPCPTNVVLTAESVLPLAPNGTAQIIYYDEGLGTGAMDTLRGGVFGAGLVKNMADAYRHLIFNYTPGDDIYVFGFSRGAYTARSFVGLLRNCGIVARRDASKVGKAIELYQSRDPANGPDAEAIRAFRAEFSPDVCVNSAEDEWRCCEVPGYATGRAPLLTVAYLGLWDTVGALGVPSRYKLLDFLNRKHRFHDDRLTSMVRSARHAVAIDETRLDFAATLWNDVDAMNTRSGVDPDDDDAPFQEKWFPGVHGSLGGGGEIVGLSHQTLDWIWDGARNAGLVLDTSSTSRIHDLRPDTSAPLDNNNKPSGFGRLVAGAKDLAWRRGNRKGGPVALRGVSISARRRWHTPADALPEGKAYRPASLAGAMAALNADATSSTPRPVPSPDTFDIIIVQRGDALRKIASRLYGDARRADEIFEMNLDKLQDPNRIYTGMSLRVPQATSSA